MNKDILDLGPLYAPQTFKNAFKSKMNNKERFLTEDMVFNLSLTDFRIITYFEITKGRKMGIDDGEENQTIKLNYTELKHRFSNKNVFYKSLKNLEELDIIKKLDGVASMYRFNPFFISNLTTAQAIKMGVVKRNLYNSKDM